MIKVTMNSSDSFYEELNRIGRGGVDGNTVRVAQVAKLNKAMPQLKEVSIVASFTCRLSPLHPEDLERQVISLIIPCGQFMSLDPDGIESERVNKAKNIERIVRKKVSDMGFAVADGFFDEAVEGL